MTGSDYHACVFVVEQQKQFLLAKIVQSTEQMQTVYGIEKFTWLNLRRPVYDGSVFIDSVFECDRNEIPRQMGLFMSKTSIHLSSSERY